MSPSRAPVLSCAHYFQAPATQAKTNHLRRSSSPCLRSRKCSRIRRLQGFVQETTLKDKQADHCLQIKTLNCIKMGWTRNLQTTLRIDQITC